MTPGMFMTEAEIDELCAPLKMAAAQVRHLRAIGLTVAVKPNGRPAVLRSHAESVLSGRRAAADEAAKDAEVASKATPQPNVAGFLKLVSKGKHGQKKKLQPA